MTEDLPPIQRLTRATINVLRVDVPGDPTKTRFYLVILNGNVIAVSNEWSVNHLPP